MARPKRDARYLNVYIDNNVVDQVDEFAEQTGIPKSRIVERALIEYMEKHVTDENGEKKYLL